MYPDGIESIGKVFISIKDDEEVKEIIEENKQLKLKVEDLEVNRISKEVYKLLDNWLDDPIPDNQSQNQDAENFAKAITRYVYRQLQ